MYIIYQKYVSLSITYVKVTLLRSPGDRENYPRGAGAKGLKIKTGQNWAM